MKIRKYVANKTKDKTLSKNLHYSTKYYFSPIKLIDILSKIKTVQSLQTKCIISPPFPFSCPFRQKFHFSKPCMVVHDEDIS